MMNDSAGRVCTVSWVTIGVVLATATPLLGREPGNPIRARPAKTELSAPTAEVPLNTRSGQPIVEAMVNGRGPFRLVLDTGARSAKLDDTIVWALALEPVRRPEKPGDTGASPEQVEVVRLDSLTLGNVLFLDFDALVLDYDQVFDGGRRYDGAIGLPIFADCLLTLDYPHGKVILEKGELPPADRSEILDYTEDEGLALLRLSFSTIPSNVTIDSGMAGAVALPTSLKGHVRVTSKPVAPSRTAGRLGIDMASMRGTLRLGRHRLSEPPVYFFGTDSAIGHQVLQYFVLTFDQKHRRVRFARAGDEPIRFGPEPGFGIVVVSKRGRLVIKHVVPGSPAAQIGISPGDKILEVNTRPAREYDEGTLTRILAESNVIDMKVTRDGLPLLIRLKKELPDSSEE